MFRGLIILFLLFNYTPVLWADQESDAFEAGVSYYEEGKYRQAVDEFQNVLARNPDHPEAAAYLRKIGQITLLKRDQVIEKEFERFEAIKPAHTENEPVLTSDEVKIGGEVRLSAGATSEDFYWNRANFDLNERNFRILSSDQLNNRENTFDPAVYQRLRLDVDVEPKDSPFNFHTNITIDPWSYTGKTQKVTVAGAGGDRAELEILFWSNTGYTVNQNFFTLDNGDSFSLSELKVLNGYVPGSTVTSTFGNTFTIPELDIDYQFQPIRELWVDYKPDDNFKLRVFPMAYESMALTSDDPLRLSNNRTYWEESQWLVDWRPGNFNAGAGDFTRGQWDDSLAFFTRDSDGTRLTALRGVALEMQPSETSSVAATIATPKDLWQDYERVEALPASLRAKNFFTDDFYVGGITNLHLGFDDAERDAYNFVGGVDAGFRPAEGLKIEGQVSTSRSERDITDETFSIKQRGNAYYLALTKSSVDNEILRKDYFGLRPDTQAENFFKTRIYGARMDEGFESTLSSYRETRDDAFWSRHLHFRPPVNPFFFEGGGIGWADLEPFAIGNGIDIGRYVLGWRAEGTFDDGKIHGLADIRNVHQTNDKYLETVARTEWSHKTTDKLTTKLFLLRHDLPNTKGGIDPFIIDPETGDFLLNSAIPDGEDPSLNTGSLGMQYDFTKWFSLHGIWEYTNDVTVGADNFPRGILNSSSFTTVTENGQTFREELPFLYSQGFFDLPPYEYRNVFKTGMNFKPDEKWNIYIDYTRNPNEHAGQIDDNMNHVGTEITYLPTPKLGVLLKYTWSRWNDLNRLLRSGEVAFESHHNVFTELRYQINDSERLRFLYGVGSPVSIAATTFDPFGGSLLTLDTQHIVRLFYQKTF